MVDDANRKRSEAAQGGVLSAGNIHLTIWHCRKWAVLEGDILRTFGYDIRNSLQFKAIGGTEPLKCYFT